MRKKDNLSILIGPTAIGKTDLSIRLAGHLNGEIISADSMQIYRHMNIGTAKISEKEMKGIPHYLVDIVYPDEEYSVADYKNQAVEIIKDINSRGKTALLVGGTGLYINSLVYDLNFSRAAANDDIRMKYEALADRYGNEYLHSELMKIDSVSANKIKLGDRKRLIRAIEVYEVTGKKMSDQNMNFRKESEDFNLIMLGLNMDRTKLYERINSRVDKMLEDGLVDEVAKLLEMGYHKNLTSLQGIGYKEIIMYMEGQISLDEAIEKIKRGTRNYAKRQLTWFKRDRRIKWFDIDKFSDIEDLLESILAYTYGQLKNKEER
ncbi:MAG: tRNA (adenosine(37)-N6)-dimethylallyltransferase MiaA [Tissierellaceae bacterium]